MGNTITVKIANAGTPLNRDLLKSGASDTSAAGHMWIEFNGKSYGFAPPTIEESLDKSAGEDSISETDNILYLDNPNDSEYYKSIRQQSFEISDIALAKLEDFLKNPTNYEFDLEYHVLTNSCVDYVWKGLEVAGFNTKGFEGNLLPSMNYMALLSLPETPGPLISYDDALGSPGYPGNDIDPLFMLHRLLNDDGALNLSGSKDASLGGGNPDSHLQTDNYFDLLSLPEIPGGWVPERGSLQYSSGNYDNVFNQPVDPDIGSTPYGGVSPNNDLGDALSTMGSLALAGATGGPAGIAAAIGLQALIDIFNYFFSSNDSSPSSDTSDTGSGMSGEDSGDPNGTTNHGGVPIVLDLDGDGVELVHIDNSTALYDFDGDGYRNYVGWVAADDGFLAYDKDGDGVIEDGDELSFVGYLEGAQTDLEGLVYFDTNDDGVLDSSDAEWSKFGVWQDLDQDGETDAGEFSSLADMGITEITLSSDDQEQNLNGNHIFGFGEYLGPGATVGEFADASLVGSAFGIGEDVNGNISLGVGDISLVRYLDDGINNSINLMDERLIGAIGGDGNDILNSEGVVTSLLVGGAGNDTLVGGEGGDWISGGEGVDNLQGGAGNDVLFFDLDDLDLLSGGGVDGGEGVDTAYVDGEQSISIELSAHNLESVIGNKGNDILSTLSDDDVSLEGGEGNDHLSGGSGDDVIIGGAGIDTLVGGAGDDVLFFDSEDNQNDISAGDGYDFAVVSDETGASFDASISDVEVLIGNIGDDTLSSSGIEGITFFGRVGEDYLTGGSGADTLDGGYGADTIDGGANIDELSYLSSYGGVEVDLEVQAIAQAGFDYLGGSFEVAASYGTVELSNSNRVATHETGNSLSVIYSLKEEDEADWNVSTLRVTPGNVTSGVTSYAFLTEVHVLDVAETSPSGYAKSIFITPTSETGYTVEVEDATGTVTATHSLTGDLYGMVDYSFAYNKQTGEVRLYVDDIFVLSLQWDAGLDVVTGHGGMEGQSVELTYERSVAIREDLGLFGANDSFGDVISNIENITGSYLNDVIRADDNANFLRGASGNDLLEGRAGGDTLDGGEGFDWASYEDSHAGVNIDLTAGTASGGHAEGDRLLNIEAVQGSAYADNLMGDDGFNSFNGGAGADTIDGGSSQDTVVYTKSSSAVSVDLLTGSTSGGDASGDVLSNIENIIGSDFDDTLSGDSAGNFLVGGEGNDILNAGAGNDSYVFNRGDGQDEIHDFYLTQDSGTDILQFGAGVTFDDLAFELIGDDLYVGLRSESESGTAASTLLEHVKIIDWTDSKNVIEYIGLIDGNYFKIEDIAVFAQGTTSDDTLDYSALSTNHLVSGSDGNDDITSGSGEDVLLGGDGDDTLDGGSGADVLIGGEGDDHYHVDNADDFVIEAEYEGIDTVETTVSYALDEGAFVETLVLASGAGNIDGTGDDYANTLTGNEGDNILTGGDGADTLDGGAGTDTASYATAEEAVSVDLGAGTGSAGDAYGDDLTNIENLTGSDHADNLVGDAGDNVLSGGLEDDTLMGGAGADTLDGEDGADTASYVSSAAAIAIDLRAGTTSGGDAVGDVLTNIENVTGSEFADTLDGDAGANILTGGLGDDILNASTGDDTYFFNSGDGQDEIHDFYEALTYIQTGQWWDNGNGDAPGGWVAIYSWVMQEKEGGDDILQLGAGVTVDDLAFELIGDDLYIGVRNESDTGTTASTLLDHVKILNWTDNKNAIETIAFADGSSFEIADIATIVQGTTSDDTLDYSASTDNQQITGFGGNDSITSGSGEDVLLGGDGDDTLDGGSGADILVGGEGDDVYHVDNANDFVIEAEYEGIDTVETTVSYALDDGAFVETLVLATGAGNIDGTGDDYANTLTGNEGDNILTGGGGADTLDGGAGTDTASYATAEEAVSVDLGAGTGSAGDAYGDDLTNIENITGSDHADNLAGDAGDNVLSGGLEDDMLMGGAGADTLDGEAGSDTASYASSAAAVTIDLGAGTASGGDAASDVLSNIENVTGSDQADTLDGDTSANVLTGGLGDDVLNASSGDDTYFFNSGDGKDEIHDFYEALTYTQTSQYWDGGNGDAPGGWVAVYSWVLKEKDGGDDILQLGVGVTVDDLAFELIGDDLYIGVRNESDTGTTASTLIDHVKILDWTDNKNAIETIAFADGSSFEIADIETFVQGTTGDDILDYSASSDNHLVTGFEGDDDITTGSGDDVLLGGLGDDTLTGGDGMDVLIGGAGDDVIIGGDGGDILLEDGGNDAALYSDSFANYSAVDDTLSGGWTITHLSSGSDGTDGVTGIEQFEFADGVMGSDGYFTAAIEGGLINLPTDAVASGTLSGGNGQIVGDLDFSLKSGPENGTVTINEDGTYSYTPDASFNGSDSFTYRFVDENGDITIGEMTVEVFDPTVNATVQQVNTYTSSTQSYSDVTGLAGGGYVVTWQSYLQDGSHYGVYGQVYDSQGTKVGTESQYTTHTASEQSNPAITGLANGDFVVSWQSYSQDGSYYGIYGQMFTAGGVPVGSEFQVNTYTNNYQYIPAISALESGGFVVTWQSYVQDGSHYGVYGQIFDAQGTKVGTETQYNTYTGSAQVNPSITGLANGNFVVSWASGNNQDGSIYGIYGQIYTAVGVAVGSEFQVNTYTASTQHYSSISALDGGGFVVTWQSNGQDGSGYGIYGQRYDAAGTAVGSEFQISTYTLGSQDKVDVVGLTSGGFVAVWASNNAQDGSSYGIFGQEYDLNGVAVGAEFQVNDYTSGSQKDPSVAALDGGGFVVTWTSAGEDGSADGIFSRIYGTADRVSTGTSGNDILIGHDGNEILEGGYGADVLEGGVGDDTLTGGLGTDSYIYSRGDGQDVIDDNASDGASDTLVLDTGIDHDQLWFEQTGDDLLISVIGTSDQITVENWYTAADNKIEGIETSDGQVTDITGVEALVSAMASFSPPGGGETDLSDPTYDPLDSVLTTNWQSSV